MARIRTIKPEFFSDDKIGECSASARLLFVGMWVFADDYGNIKNSPKQLKAQIFPYDNVNCEELISELEKQGLVNLYSVEGCNYLHINNFTKHQKIDHPSKFRLPFDEGSVRTRRGLGEDSTRTRALKERKGKEGNSKGICTLESVKPFLTWWGEQFKEHCHDIYICNFQKDTPIVKELIRAFGDVEVRKRAVRFLSDHGDFVTRAGHTIGVFKTKINSYSDEVVNGKSRNNNSENNGGVKPPTGKYANVGK